MLFRENRLKSKDFKEIRKGGRFFNEQFLSLIKAENNLNQSRFGFVVSQKISKKAVIRNKIKRRLREIIRNNLDKIKKNYNVIFIAKKGIEEKEFKEIKEITEQLLKKARLL